MKKTDIFHEVGEHSVVHSVVMQFEQLIVDGVLREGMKLPPERQLAAQFLVSREKVREAVRVLERAKLLVARQGDGTYVSQLTGKAFSPAMLELYSRHPKGLDDYLEYRKEIEGFAARLAAERASAVDKEIINECLQRHTEALKIGDLEAALREDVVFHSVIAKAAHNSMITHTTASIYDLMEKGIMYNRAILRKSDQGNLDLFRQHERIANAICDGRPDEALVASDAHIDYVVKVMHDETLRAQRNALAQKRRLMDS